MGNIILFNKPYNVLSQFTDKSIYQENRLTLSNYITHRGFYAAGRLDKDSEGLLVLTNNGKIQSKITDPKNKTKKIYWVQVEGQPSEEILDVIRRGEGLKDGKYLPAHIKVINEPANLWTRTPPIRYRKNITDSWLEIILTEGKNRQIRRMTAAIGHPTLRLIRYSIGNWNIKNLDIGSYYKITTD